MLEINNLSYLYPGSDEGVRDLNFQVAPGEIFAILGRSGAGKTTLLRCLGRFIEPQKGTINIDGENALDLNEVDFRRRLGIVFQKLHLFPHLTVEENLLLAPDKALGENMKAARETATTMLNDFDIEKLLNKYPSEISGGQAQRVAICRALMLKPAYLLLDEPTAALDVQTTRDFADFLKLLTEQTTPIIVTHDVDFAQQVASRGITMEAGSITTDGPIEEIIASISNSAPA